MKQINHHRRGMTVLEQAIVLGVIALMLSGIWVVAGNARQNVRWRQAMDAIASTADGMRSAYGNFSNPGTGANGIVGGVNTVVPYVVNKIGGVIPTSFMRTTTTLCQGISSQYADVPWSSSGDVCGSFRLCAWNYGATTSCPMAGTVTPYAFFAVELAYMDFATCVNFAANIQTSQPPGLVDIYVNGSSTLNANNVLPAPVSWANGQCVNASTNVIDFVYAQRAPNS